MNSDLYSRYRFPAEIINHAVWLYFRFTLSFRDIEEMLAARGILVSNETVRQWSLKFGQIYANSLRRKQPKRGDKWYLDEVYLTINGKFHYLWRAVDQEGNVLDGGRSGYVCKGCICQIKHAFIRYLAEISRLSY